MLVLLKLLVPLVDINTECSVKCNVWCTKHYSCNFFSDLWKIGHGQILSFSDHGPYMNKDWSKDFTTWGSLSYNLVVIVVIIVNSCNNSCMVIQYKVTWSKHQPLSLILSFWGQFLLVCSELLLSNRPGFPEAEELLTFCNFQN